MSDSAIVVQNLSKQYVLGGERERYWTIRDTFADAVRRVTNFAAGRSSPPRERQRFWALKDINLSIAPGEIVGIIGHNGAGKSTLLKILSRVTYPTSGRIELWGRVGSLLEVGTGFHPELTGRENVLLNGAILGMRREEILRKFDEIVAFSEVERFLDTPVKHYSSGMYVRLAFAVAAHMEPEILLVDEVLAVGDAAFRAKCLGKMEEVASQHRTVLFVSHNMSAIAKLTTRCILLDRGEIVMDGAPDDVVHAYLRRPSEQYRNSGEKLYSEDSNKDAQVLRMAVRNPAGVISGSVRPDEGITLEADFVVRRPRRDMYLVFMLDLPDGTWVCHSSTAGKPGFPEQWPEGLHTVQAVIPGGILNVGRFVIRTGLGQPTGYAVDAHKGEGLALEINEGYEVEGTVKRRELLAIQPTYTFVSRDLADARLPTGR